MRVAVVHSFYSSNMPSGENRVVEDQAALLSQQGHEVMLFGVSTDDEKLHPLYGPRTAVRVLTRTGVSLMDDLRTFAPDVVHVHNTFPNIGTRWLRRWDGPVVMSVHNYRAACSNGLLLRDGLICHDCVDPDTRWAPAVRHACYRNSRVATLPVALSRAGFRRDLVSAAVTAVTTSQASDVMFRRMTQGRVPSVVIPNFVEDHANEGAPVRTGRRGWIVVSRLSPEKGVLELVSSWPADQNLTVVGDGPEAEAIAFLAHGSANVRVVTSMPREELRGLLRSHLGLVFPSRWHEVAPQVVLEAMCAGLPIVAFQDNDIATMVGKTGSGRSYQDPDELAETLADIDFAWEKYSSIARSVYLENWTPETWLERVLRLYRTVTK